jgi:enamine deaminase RidA (YjgF/YER057c/UK114 family)
MFTPNLRFLGTVMLSVLFYSQIYAMTSAPTKDAQTVEEKLASLSITLPVVNPPIANFVPCVRTGKKGKIIYISGQLPRNDKGAVIQGVLGQNLSVEEGFKAAELCATHVLAVLKEACGGNLDRVKRCVRLGVFVRSTQDFADHSKVANGASNLMVNVFGDAGKHARAAVGVLSLPSLACVEVEATFEVKPEWISARNPNFDYSAEIKPASTVKLSHRIGEDD